MSRALSKSLGTDLASLAQVLRSKGRGRDTVLAHITPKEAALLKRRGGRGSINPDTGLPEFGDDDSPIIDSSADTGGASEFGGTPAAPVNTAPVTTQTPSTSQQELPPPVSDQATWNNLQPSAPQQNLPAVNDQSTWDNLQPAAAQQNLPPPVSDQATWDKLQSDKPGPSDTIGKYLSDPANLAKLGLLGGLGIFGAIQGTKASQQTAAATGQIAAMAPVVQDQSAAAQQQLQQIAQNAQTQGATSAANLSALGAPAEQLGTGMMTNAVAGNLTPANQQAMAALKAQAEQGISDRGGVGAMQAGVAEENAQAQLAQQQLQQGLATYQQGAAYDQQAIALQQSQDNMAAGIQQQSVSTALAQAQIADQYTLNAIMTGLQMDQATAQSLKSFYTSLAQVGFSQSGTAQTKYNPNTGALN